MILFIIMQFTHWLFDFNLQTSEQALNKSKSLKALFSHVSEYSLGMFIVMLSMLYFYFGYSLEFCIQLALIFWSITFICHFTTDFFTSKITSKRYADDKMYGFNNFWSWIGFDQLLHSIQLTLTLAYFELIRSLIF